MTRISTDRLTWSKQTRSFVAEISDFNGTNLQLARLYPDACDVGLTLVSHRTGREATYALYQEVRSEGEVQAWEFTPTRETLRAQPQLKGTKVVLFND